MSAPESWDAQALWQAMSPLLPGLSIEVVERLESTNTVLMDRLRAPAAPRRDGERRRAVDFNPVMLVAVHQTRGRGRMGRIWHAEAGSALTFSLALPLRRTDWSGLSLVAGLAVAEALDVDGAHLGLKWPNDVWLREPQPGTGRKLAGVLVETLGIGDQRVAVVGIGVNVRPQRLAELPVPAACLSELDPTATPQAALARIAPVLASALAQFDRDGFTVFADRYARRDLLRGQWVTTTDAQCPQGRCEGLAPDGALAVRCGTALQWVRSGEVSVRPQADPVSAGPSAPDCAPG